jgi:sarcosine oxidase
MQHYDVAVVGLGAMGSAAAYHLAGRGVRVLGLERFTPAHALGSSHGRSRIIRQAYFESPVYVPLLLRAYELWRRLEEETGRRLLVLTGGLLIGPGSGQVVSGAVGSARLHGLPYELLGADELRRRYPVFRVPDDHLAVHEPDAGALFPEDCITAHLDRARALGADLRFETPLHGWRATSGGVRLSTAGEAFEVDRVVVTAGSWAGRLVADLDVPLAPERNVVHWFDPADRAEDFAPERFPVFIWDDPERLYGLPDLRGEGVKVAFHHSGEIVDPDRVRRDVGEEEVARMRRRLQACLPALNGRVRGSSACLYTNTPDEHFAIGVPENHPRLVVAAGFSGHGFKFASVVGEVLADLATAGSTKHPLAPFALDRFPAR